MAYTTIDDPSAFFQTTLYTGNGGTQSITNDGNSDLKPDWLWTKSRSDASFHLVTDSTRGTGKRLYTNSTSVEESHSNMVTAFNSDGFSVGNHSAINTNNYNYVAWQWEANGGTTTSFSESGNNPGGNRQTNTDAGFSIISYTGTGANASCVLAHGLPSTPEFVVFKRRNAANWWVTYHQGIGVDYKLALQVTAGKDSDGAFMNGTIPDATNIYVGGTSVHTNADNGTYICYAFSPIQGYSKFGSYVGNGNGNGPFVYTGFKPAWVMIKRTDTTGGWTIYDHKRGHNGNNYELFPHSAEAEYTGTSYFEADILSNGFKLRLTDGQVNASGGTYVYMAFAENPFVTSTGIMGTAR
tara:strand:- start:154 stop:1215 length:1062 start_codon:yes stop_codon:yes gene_type:complete